MLKYSDKGYTVHDVPPKGKDFNDDLKEFISLNQPKITHKPPPVKSIR